MIVGDSVAFGVGVEFEQTAAALLASALPEFRIYNSAVIGYGVNDYRNVATTFLPRFADTINQVMVLFCLNDVSVVSAANIRATMARAAVPVKLSAGIDVQSLKEISFISSMNDYLRSRSSLYVLVRGALTDPQTRYWHNELGNYRKLSEAALAEILDPINHIAGLFNAGGVSFTVFVLPFAGQMETGESRLPQQKLGEFFGSRGIDYVDLLPRFRAGKNPDRNFLPFDPMHLSPEGHRVLFQAMRERVARTQTD